MTIRVTGLNSGLDTDSIIQELVSAYRSKGDKIKKQQIKLSWTQDIWKSLNAKVLKLYKSLDNLRFTSGYNMKKTTVSDPTKATITASKNATNGSQSLRIEQLAKSGYLTGGQLKNNKKGSAATLGDLGYGNGTGTYTISNAAGTAKAEFEVNSNTTIKDFISQINNSGVGVTASYDETNQRIFIQSKSSGEANDFVLMGKDENGTKALTKLGVNASSARANEAAKGWMEYYDGTGADLTKLQADVETIADAKFYMDAYAKDTEARQAENSKASAAIGYYNAYKSNLEVRAAVGGAKNAMSAACLANMSDQDLEKQYVVAADGNLTEATSEQLADPTLQIVKGSDYYTQIITNNGIQKMQPKWDENGQPVVDENGIQVQEETQMFQQIRNYAANNAGIGAYEGDPANSAYVLPVGADGNDAETSANYYKSIIEANNEAISKNQDEMYKLSDTLEKYKLLDSAAITKEMSSMANPDAATTAARDAYIQDLAQQVEYIAANYVAEVGPDGKVGYVPKQGILSEGASRVDAQDAIIYLNGAQFKSDTNTFNVNGLSIQATATTGEDEVTITTATDTQGLYDKIKDFINEYNAIINEMSALYSAPSAKGYEPLMSEEKQALSDSEVADWEKKVKDSLLRRDSNLSTLISVMTSSMSSTVNVNGKKYSLASLGIKTESYFSSTAATRNMYHIDGDEDDDTTSANENKLMAMLNSDPDTVIGIMRGLTDKLSENLGKQMRSSTLRSFQSIYNDKAMSVSYSDYTKKISAWEEKVTKIEDDYYKKFAAMEQALGKLQSQQSAFAGLLG